MKSTLPKLAKDLAALVGIARRETSVEKIEAALGEARSQVDAAVADYDRAQSSYTAGLLDASAADLEKLVTAKGQATIRKDQAEALVAALTERLAMAREAEAKAERKAVHDEARGKSEAITARLPGEYRRLATGLRDLMRDVADAELATEAANKFGDEFGFLPLIEWDLRGRGGVPEEIIEDIEIEAWAIDGRQQPLAEDEQKRVKIYADRPTKGTWAPAPSSDYVSVGGHFDCSKRRFRKITFRPFVPGPDAGSLFAELRLPAFEAGGADFYRGRPGDDAGSALKQTNDEMWKPEPRGASRPTQVKWEQVVEPHPSSPAARQIHAQDRSNIRELTHAA